MFKFQERLSQLRKEKNCTQEDLGAILGVTGRTVGHWEVGRNEPDQETLGKIADYFGVSIDYLLGKTDIRNPYEIIAAYSSGGDMYTDLPPEAIREIESFKQYVYQKWRGWKPGDPPR